MSTLIDLKQALTAHKATILAELSTWSEKTHGYPAIDANAYYYGDDFTKYYVVLETPNGPKTVRVEGDTPIENLIQQYQTSFTLEMELSA